MAWERRQRVEELRDNVSRLQTSLRKRRDKQDSLRSLLDAAPPSDDIESEDDSMLHRCATDASDGSTFIQYPPSSRRSQRSPMRSPRKGGAVELFESKQAPSLLTLYTQTRSSTTSPLVSPRHLSPAREREYHASRSARKLLFQQSNEARQLYDSEEDDSDSPPVMSIRRERDEIISLATQATQVNNNNNNSNTYSMNRSGSTSTMANATTQVNGEVCSCGRQHNHGHSSPHGPTVIEEYCVHATTTTKTSVPRYAQPTWTSWPVASRRSPAEIDPYARVTKRSPSHSPFRSTKSGTPRRPSPSPMRRGGSPRPRSARSSSAGGFHTYWDKLHYEGVSDKQRRINTAIEAKLEKKKKEEAEHRSHSYKPNFYRTQSRERSHEMTYMKKTKTQEKRELREKEAEEEEKKEKVRKSRNMRYGN